MPPMNHQTTQHAWVSRHLMLSCSQAPWPEPRTLIPSSQTACIDWLPLNTTSRGDMGRPSLYICQEWGSATIALGANCTHMACDTYHMVSARHFWNFPGYCLLTPLLSPKEKKCNVCMYVNAPKAKICTGRAVGGKCMVACIHVLDTAFAGPRFAALAYRL